MGNYYLHKEGFLIQTGSCADGDEELQGMYGNQVGLGDPPIELQPKPTEQPDPVLLALYKRSQLLLASDWTQLPDVPLATKEVWATYRQALRDITEQAGYPVEIIWPIEP